MTLAMETWKATCDFAHPNTGKIRTVRVELPFPDGLPMTEIADGLGEAALARLPAGVDWDLIDQQEVETSRYT